MAAKPTPPGFVDSHDCTREFLTPAVTRRFSALCLVLGVEVVLVGTVVVGATVDELRGGTDEVGRLLAGAVEGTRVVWDACVLAR